MAIPACRLIYISASNMAAIVNWIISSQDLNGIFWHPSELLTIFRNHKNLRTIYTELFTFIFVQSMSLSIMQYQQLVKTYTFYYCKCCNLIGYFTRYLFVNRYRVAAMPSFSQKKYDAFSSFFRNNFETNASLFLLKQSDYSLSISMER